MTHLIAQKVPLNKPTWTVGCSVEVKLHEFKEGTPQQKTYFIELWDVGGSSSHRNTRHVFYLGVQGIRFSLYKFHCITYGKLELSNVFYFVGIILVHDLTNRKSQENLYKWLGEVFSRESGSKLKKNEEFDVEQFVGYSQVLLRKISIIYLKNVVELK